MKDKLSGQTVGRDGEGRHDVGLADDGERSGRPLHGNDQNAKASVHGSSPRWIGLESPGSLSRTAAGRIWFATGHSGGSLTTADTDRLKTTVSDILTLTT